MNDCEIMDWVNEDFEQYLLVASDSYEQSDCARTSARSTHAPPLHELHPSTYTIEPRPHCSCKYQHCSCEFLPRFLSSSSSQSHSCFAPPKTDTEILCAREAGIPFKTKEDTKYCVRVWEDWREHRQQQHKFQHYWQLQSTLDDTFHPGGKEEDGWPLSSKYSAPHHCRLHQTIWSSYWLFKDASFTQFRASLDGELKWLQSEVIGSRKRQAEIITEEDIVAEGATWWQKSNTLRYYGVLLWTLFCSS